MMETNSEKVVTALKTLRIDPRLHGRLKAHFAAAGVPMKAGVEQVLRDWLRDGEQKKAA